MNAVLALFRSTVGRKIVMAVTGLALFGFVAMHMAANLQAFVGTTKLDEYGAALRKIPALLWAARLGLIGAAVLHVWSAASLTLESWAARPKGYSSRRWQDSDYASRTMRITGALLLVFIPYHILHFTIGNVHPDFIEGGVHHNLVVGLRVLPVAAFYLAAMLCLGFHLWHGVWSLTQTLGLAHPRYDALRRGPATTFAVLVVLGFMTVPVGVLGGVIDLAPPLTAASGIAR